jgi:NAD(P)-dependent dehydrogenase (short-subunit alcohol dehydrogenase family)
MSVDLAFRHLVAGKRILLIGAGSGIGRAIAEMVEASSAHLLMIDRDIAAVEGIAAQANHASRPADITDRAALASAMDELAKCYDGFDCLIMTAGIGLMKPLDETSYDDWDRTVDINLTGNFNACKLAIPHLTGSTGASIVLTASAAGLHPAATSLSAYSAAKSGVIGLGRALSQELAPAIRVNTICPGPVDTPLLPEPFRKHLASPHSAYPMKRAATPQEIAHLALFLVSDAASYMNGATIAIDGGRSLH